MPGKDVPRLSKRTVDAFAVVDKDAIFWDRDLPSFGVRVYTTGRKVYVVQTRGPGGPKRVSIGRHGEVTAEQARKQAVVIIDRIKQGLEPVPAPELTVAVLAERYLQGHVAVNCRASTLESVPEPPHHIHPAGIRRASHRRGGPGASGGAALQASRHALPGQRGGRRALAAVRTCRGVGAGAARREPVPVGAPVQGGQEA